MAAVVFLILVGPHIVASSEPLDIFFGTGFLLLMTVSLLLCSYVFWPTAEES